MKKFEKLSDGKFKQFEITDTAKLMGGAQADLSFEYYVTEQSATNEPMVSNKDCKVDA